MIANPDEMETQIQIGMGLEQFEDPAVRRQATKEPRTANNFAPCTYIFPLESRSKPRIDALCL